MPFVLLLLLLLLLLLPLLLLLLLLLLLVIVLVVPFILSRFLRTYFIVVVEGLVSCLFLFVLTMHVGR